MLPPGPATSCAYKNLLVYRTFFHTDAPYALILEDDIYLYQHFCVTLEKIINKVRGRNLRNFIISMEESSLTYIERSQRIRHQLLYKKPAGRMAVAYIIDRDAAHAITTEISLHRCHLPIDWFHNHCSDKVLIHIYWSHPPIAVQGSLNGRLPSLIDHKYAGTLKILKFHLNRLYKLLLNSLR